MCYSKRMIDRSSQGAQGNASPADRKAVQAEPPLEDVVPQIVNPARTAGGLGAVRVALSAAAGRITWGDERFFLQAKMPCAPELLVDYAHSVASVIAASMPSQTK